MLMAGRLVGSAASYARKRVLQMYKDKEKQREANRESARRYRLKGMTPIQAIVSADITFEGEGITPPGVMVTGITPKVEGITSYPDIKDKIVEGEWQDRYGGWNDKL